MTAPSGAACSRLKARAKESPGCQGGKHPGPVFNLTWGSQAAGPLWEESGRAPRRPLRNLEQEAPKKVQMGANGPVLRDLLGGAWCLVPGAWSPLLPASRFPLPARLFFQHPFKHLPCFLHARPLRCREELRSVALTQVMFHLVEDLAGSAAAELV